MPVATDESPGKPDTEGPAPQPSLLKSLQALWRELPGLVSDRVDLLALEMQRAGSALLQIVALVVGAAILAVTAWLALWGALIGVLVSLGLHWSVALLLALVLNLAAAWWALVRVRSLVPALRLSATRRHLTLTPSPQPREAPPDPGPAAGIQPAPTYANNASNAAGSPIAP